MNAAGNISPAIAAERGDVVPSPVRMYSELIAEVLGNRVVLNVRARFGIQVGVQLSVRRVSRTITDPATGRELRRVGIEVGSLRVVAVEEVSATADVLSGSDLRIGDRVTFDPVRQRLENVLGRKPHEALTAAFDHPIAFVYTTDPRTSHER